MQKPGLSVKPANCVAFSFSGPQQRASLPASPLMGARNERCCRHHFSGRPYAGGSVVNAPHLLKPNVADISAHLHALFPPGFVHGFPDAQAEIVHGPPGTFTDSRWFSAFDLKAIVDFAEAQNASGENIYVGAALRRGPVPESGRANAEENYLAAQYAWAEYDGEGDYKRIVAICRENNLKPAIVITTGTVPNKRDHLYFYIEGGIVDPAGQKEANTRFRDLFDSDDVTDPIRIMRLGGCVNYPKKEKIDRGYIAELVTVRIVPEMRKYSIDDLPASQRSQLNGAARTNSLGIKLARTDADIWNLLQTSKVKDWHNSMRDAIASMIGRGWSDDAIRFSCAAYCRDSKDDTDLGPLIEGGRRKFNKPNPDNDNSGAASTQAGIALPARIALSSAEFVAGFVPPDYIYDGIFQRRYLYAITALTGAGKTAIALLLSAHIALGKPIGDVDVDQGRVLYMAGENPDDVRARWIAMSEQMKFDVNTIPVHFVPGAYHISQTAERIGQELESIGPVAAVIIDTSAAYFESDDENNNVQAGAHARRMRELIKTFPGNPVVIVLCHPVKNPDTANLLPKGGGSFLNEVDGNAVLLKNDSVVTLTWHGKFRGADFNPVTFELMTVTSDLLVNKKGKKVPTVLARPMNESEQRDAEATIRDEEDRLLIAVLDSDGASMKGLADLLHWQNRKGEPDKRRVQKRADDLRKGGYLKTERGTLELTEKGEKVAKKAKTNLAPAGSSYG
jgi:hypothetical protein